MTKTVDDYLNLITSQYRNKPKFTAIVSGLVAVAVQLQTVLASMVDIFDIDLNPVGDQLDIIGEWVGVSRIIQNPFSDIFFSWDGTAKDGWDFGVWREGTDPSALVSLPDDIYLTLIKARIAANYWDGTTSAAYDIWRILFPQMNLLIQDYQNMSFVVVIQGFVPDSLTLALLTGGYLPLKPEGVLIANYVVPIDTGALFAWDVETSVMAGWDTGSWGTWIAPT